MKIQKKNFNIIWRIFVLVIFVINPLAATTNTVYAVGEKIGFVTDTGGLDDQYGWNPLTNQGLVKAENDFGVVGTRYESTLEDEYEPLLQQCVDDGNELCIASSFMLYDAIVNIATANPGANFLIVDRSVDVTLPNLRGAVFSPDQIGYLAGALAGKMTATNKIGDVAGMNIPPVSAFVDGYTNGAQCANPDVEVLTDYTGTFVDPLLGATTAQGMMDQGADVIFGVGGMTGNGAILHSAQNSIWSIGVDTDQYLSVFENGAIQGSEYMLSSAMKNLDFAVYLTIDDHLNGVFTAGTVEYDLAAGGVALAPFHEADASIPQVVKDYIVSVEQGIINGSIDINDPCRVPPPVGSPEYPIQIFFIPSVGEQALQDGGQIMADYLNTQTGLSFTVNVPSSFPDTVYQMCESPDRSMGFMPGFGYVLGNDFCSLDVSHKAIRFGWGNYWAEILVPRDSTITSISDLDGLSWGIPDYTSASGYMAPLVMWNDASITPSGPVEAGDHSEAVKAVYNGAVDFATAYFSPPLKPEGEPPWQPGDAPDIPSGVWENCGVVSDQLLCYDSVADDYWRVMDARATVRFDAPDVVQNVRILDISPPIANDTMSFGPDFSPALRAQIETAMIAFAGTDDWMNSIGSSEQYGWEGITPAIDSDYEFTREMVAAAGITLENWGDGPEYGYVLHAVPNHPEVHGHDWPPGSEVTLTIDDDNDPGNGVLYEETKNVDDEPLWCGYPCFDLDGVFTLAVGQYVSMTDGDVTKTVQISPMVITEVDPVADTVSGVGNAGERLAVNIWSQGGTARYVTIEPNGAWVAEFSVPGDEDFEQNTADIGPGDHGRAIQLNPDGSDDGTLEYWSIYNPFLTVFPEFDSIEAWEWPDGAPVHLEIDDPATGENPDYEQDGVVAVAPWEGDNRTYLRFEFGEEYDLKVADSVTVTDGVTYRTHVVQYLTVIEANAELDYVAGTANAGEVVYVWPHGFDEFGLQPITDGSGNWQADFTTVGFDIQPGTDGGRAEVRDEDGDSTAVDWNIPSPHLTVFQENEAVEAWEWSDGSSVHLAIDDPATGEKPDFEQDGIMAVTTWGDPRTYIRFEFGGEYDLKIGDSVTVTDGETARTHVVQYLTVTEVNAETEIVVGTTDPGRVVFVWPHEFGEFELQPIADGAGNWQADFTTVGYDIQPGTDGGRSEVRDEDGNSTAVDWNVSNPWFAVRIDSNWVEANEWDLGVSLTLEIDDPDNGPGVDYTDTQTVEEAPWDPNQTYAEIHFEGAYDVQPEDEFTLTDGNTVKTHVVTNIEITGYDLDNDLVFGIADPNSKDLLVYACNEEYCSWRHVDSDSGGNWTADFGNPGILDDEQDIYDIVEGTWLDSQQGDDDGDLTFNGKNVTNPFIEVRANNDQVHGYDFPEGATATIEIDDPGTPENPDYTDTAMVDTAPWDPNSTYFDLNLWDVFDIQPGFEVTVSDGVTIKQHMVTNLEFTNIDIENDIVSGIATPNGQLDIWACEFNNCYNVDEVPVDGSGNWSANFQGVFDIQPGTWIDSIQRDEFDNGTMFGMQTQGAEIAGTVYAVAILPGNEAGGVMVEACMQGADPAVCRIAITDGSGNFLVEYLPVGIYDIEVIPAGDNIPAYLSDINVPTYDTHDVGNIVLSEPPPPPPPDAIEPTRGGDGPPSVFIGDSLTLTAHGEPDGTATFELVVLNDGHTVMGPMIETPPGSGTYIAEIDPLHPHHGPAEVTYTITYPDKPTVEIPFFIYIDPSGVVVTITGTPIAGATVTLLRSDNPNGPFEVVPNGSVIMSQSNRTNPDTTDELGRYGWDVVAGFYIVRAEMPGCFAPGDPSQPFYESEVLTIPPPVTDLELILDCPNLSPIADAGMDHIVDEGAEVTLDGSGSFDPEGEALTYNWDLDNDGEYDDASGISAMVSFPDQGIYTVGLQVVETAGLTGTDTVQITVNNAAPVVNYIAGPTDPVALGNPVEVTGYFTDSGLDDTHAATWDWGDNETSVGTITGFTVAGEHMYGAPGVYLVTLTVEDDDGGQGMSEFQYVVVYDPSGGFVTGGGWFNMADGKANFGFNANYHADAKVPYGNTQFKLDDVKFKATSYDWLVISGARAQFKGTGTINKSGEHGFFITIIDGKISGGEDLFRIKIWDLTTGDVVYDNQPGDPDAADPVVEIGGGSIVIHKAK